MRHENLGGHVGDDELRRPARVLLRIVRLEVRHDRLLDARDLGVGGGPGEIEGAGVDGFSVTCSVGACSVRGDIFKQEDVSVVPAVDGRREAACGVDNGLIELAEDLVVVVDARDWHNGGVHPGVFGGAPRRDAGGGAHGGDGNGGGGLGFSVVLKLEAITVRLHRG